MPMKPSTTPGLTYTSVADSSRGTSSRTPVNAEPASETALGASRFQSARSSPSPMIRKRARGSAATDNAGSLDEQLVALARVQRADGRDDQRVCGKTELAPHRLMVVGRRLERFDVQSNEVEVDQCLSRAPTRFRWRRISGEMTRICSAPSARNQLRSQVVTGSSRGEFCSPIGELTTRTPDRPLAPHAQREVDGHRRGCRKRVHQVDVLFDDEAADLACGLGDGQWRGDIERGLDVLRARAPQVVDQLTARRDHPHVVTATVQLASKGHHDALQPADTHRFRGEQNPHRPRRL